MYQIDIDINKERKITLQLYEDDILEDVLRELKVKHDLSERSIKKIHEILLQKIT